MVVHMPLDRVSGGLDCGPTQLHGAVEPLALRCPQHAIPTFLIRLPPSRIRIDEALLYLHLDALRGMLPTLAHHQIESL